MMKKVSSAADLSKVYNNGSMRPTVVTELLASGLGNRQVMEFSGHKSGAMVQHYSRKLEQMIENGNYSTTLVPDILCKVTTQKIYAPVPKLVQNFEWCRKLEQSIEN